MGEITTRREFDFDTIAEAKEHIGSMFDTDTREGQRLFEESMRFARIRERDVEELDEIEKGLR